MKRYVTFLWITFSLSVSDPAYSSVTVSSWNLYNFGKSKSDQSIQFIANTLKNSDIIAVQEVLATPGGAIAVARLQDALNRTGTKWDYALSDPTTSSLRGSERYAFLWKTNVVKLVGRAWLEPTYVNEIDREPFMATFRKGREEFTLVSFHAVPKSKHPESEIKYFKFLPAIYPKLKLVFCGDFNVSQSNTCFNPLKSLGYEPVFTRQKTTLRDRCINDDCLASEYDNFFCTRQRIIINRKEAILFFKSFPDMKSARRISDHLPISISIDIR